MKQIAIIGATGSIGQSALDVIRTHRQRFVVTLLSARSNVDALVRDAAEFKPKFITLENTAKKDELINALQQAKLQNSVTPLFGEDGLLEALESCEANLCISAAVGSAGLVPTLKAIDMNMDIALANKETLVAGGAIVTEKAAQKNIKLLPVDSEHSALFQCLHAGKREEVRKLILTASGGPFRGYTKEQLATVTAQAALSHPTWQMGRKVTIDSATLANKALEAMEAQWLFNLQMDKIEVLIHQQSIIHGLVEYHDGSIVAQLAKPDMRIPIQYALSYPNRLENAFGTPDFAKLKNLTFETPDAKTFPMLELGYKAAYKGGTMPAVYSAANEAAVQFFLSGKISFYEINKLVEKAMESCVVTEASSAEAILNAENNAKSLVIQTVSDMI